jgi:spore coat polysaccharide biosynthesis protein SpsF
MGSTRLPGKVLLPFGNSVLLGWILDRLSEAPWLVVVATTAKDEDRQIVQYCEERGAAVFRGSEHDVLKRYRACVSEYEFDHVVRLTADNPFTDVEEMRRLVALHLGGGFDYSHSFGQLPVGVGAEIFSAAVLVTSDERGTESQHREHVNEYVLENPGAFCVGRLNVPESKCRSPVALTIDTPADYQRISGYLPVGALPTIDLGQLEVR